MVFGWGEELSKIIKIMKNTTNATKDTEGNSTNTTMPTVEDLQEMCFEDYKDSQQQSDGDRHLEVAVDSRPTKAPVLQPFYQPTESTKQPIADTGQPTEATKQPIADTNQPTRKLTKQPSAAEVNTENPSVPMGSNSWTPLNEVSSSYPSIAARKSIVPTRNIVAPSRQPSIYSDKIGGDNNDKLWKDPVIKTFIIAGVVLAGLGGVARMIWKKFRNSSQNSTNSNETSEESTTLRPTAEQLKEFSDLTWLSPENLAKANSIAKQGLTPKRRMVEVKYDSPSEISNNEDLLERKSSDSPERECPSPEVKSGGKKNSYSLVSRAKQMG